MIELAPGPQPSMPAHSAADIWLFPLAVIAGTLNEPLTDVNGPPLSAYPDQLLLLRVGASGAGATRESVTKSVRGSSAVWPCTSATCAVNGNCPAAPGVPARTPSPLSARPGGNAPAAIVHAYGPVPPSAVSVTEYGSPSVPFGTATVVSASAGAGIGLTGIGFPACSTVMLPKSLRLSASLAVTEKCSVTACL